VLFINLIRLLLYCEEEFSLKERAFYGDGGRIIKVKVKMVGYARVFNVPTKIITIFNRVQNYRSSAFSSKHLK